VGFAALLSNGDMNQHPTGANRQRAGYQPAFESSCNSVMLRFAVSFARSFNRADSFLKRFKHLENLVNRLD
jgi:hypothetical protein